MSGRVAVRELRQNLSRYLDRVEAGESLVVTERGREVARLISYGPDGYTELARRFHATMPTARLERVGERISRPRAPAGSTDAFLAESRDDRAGG